MAIAKLQDIGKNSVGPQRGHYPVNENAKPPETMTVRTPVFSAE